MPRKKSITEKWQDAQLFEEQRARINAEFAARIFAWLCQNMHCAKGGEA